MNITILSEDRAALPDGLLAIAKEHLRVDWSYDDTFIKSVIARAVDWFQRETGVTVNPSEYDWRPDQAEFVTPPTSPVDPARCPFTPVNEFHVTDAAAADITANYAMVNSSVHGVQFYRLEGSWVSGMVVNVKSGYAAANMHPGILDALLRYAAHLYEHREILVPERGALTPGWMTDVMATWWVPRA